MSRLAVLLDGVDTVDLVGLLGLAILTCGIAFRFGADIGAIVFGVLILAYAVAASRPLPSKP